MIPIVAHGASDVGRHRTLNEDSFYVGTHLFLVADGMGGHAAGDVASRLVCEAMRAIDREGLVVADVEAAIAAAHGAVIDYGATHPDSEGMGSTLSGVVLLTGGPAVEWLWFNVGDSRVYRYGEDGLRQVTVDHSEVQVLLDRGLITSEEARTHPSRHIITRSMGESPAGPADLGFLALTPGATLMICSDGLTTELTDGEVEGILATAGSPREAAEVLMQRALAAGGHDNVTIVVVSSQGFGASAADRRSTVPRERLNGESQG